MDGNLLQLLRFAHIVSASIWVGITFTLAFFIHPALLTGDFAAARFLTRVMLRHKLGIYLPIVVVLALASGLWLYRIDFPHLTMQTFTPRALDYILGGFFGIIAFIVGVSVNLPTGGKIASLTDSMGAGAPTAEQSNELARLSRRLLISGRSTAILTLGAVALMALARFAR
jgi:uncharacterized membrane protein